MNRRPVRIDENGIKGFVSRARNKTISEHDIADLVHTVEWQLVKIASIENENRFLRSQSSKHGDDSS